MGACDQNQVEEILDFFYAQGGNFIDTANNYQFEESEQWIGEWMKKRDNRDQMGEYSWRFVKAAPARLTRHFSYCHQIHDMLPYWTR